jgi:V/A-type H+-transporting ATPase subunit D
MKLRLTKGELKRQRDALKAYQRYLPTLQLKKQQLQMEILRQIALLEEKGRQEQSKKSNAMAWSGLLNADRELNLGQWLKPKEAVLSARNIAGLDLPVFQRLEFAAAEYDLFLAPLWADAAIEILRTIVSLRKEIQVILEGIEILRQELRVTNQRVNLFEKVKIPEAQGAIRRIKIYLGDQMANAVGRSKIAKRKIEQAALEEALV